MQKEIDGFDFDYFVINLKRSSERLESFRAENQSCQLPIQRFEAIDGSQLDASTIAQFVAPGTARYTPGIVGCAMSHRALWERCIASEKPHVIFEDDAVIRADIKAQLGRLLAETPDWDIILLGYSPNALLEINIAPGTNFYIQSSVPNPSASHLSHFVGSTSNVSLQRLVTAFGICGYIITPNAARELINTCFPMDNRIIHIPINRSLPSYGVDCLMNIVYRRTRSYACLAPLVMISHDIATSTIGH